MSDPLSLAVLGDVGLTEGIKFLYGQAGEVLARWRNREAEQAQGEEPMAIDSPLLEGQLAPARVNHETIERLEGELTGLAGRLGNYANGLQKVDPGDVEMLEAADALRRALEVIYGQRRTPIATIERTAAMIDRLSRRIEDAVATVALKPTADAQPVGVAS